MFQGFTERTFDFLWELQLHNERPWFMEHKAEFESAVRQPFLALAGDTLRLMQTRFPKNDFQIHISRIYRDARRLFGRGPYCESLWFSIQRGDDKARGPRFWFDIDSEGYAHGMGFWDAKPVFGETFRRMIDAQPKKFEELVLSLPDREHLKIDGTEYKRPKGSRGEVIDPWYNRKAPGVEYHAQFGKAVLTPELPELLVNAYAELMPLYGFFLTAHQLSLESEDEL